MPTIDQIKSKYKDINPLDLDILISRAINKTREFVLAHLEYRLKYFNILILKYWFFLRRRGWSVAHIIHHKEFYGLDFFVNRHVLMPRPETEMMVDEISNFQPCLPAGRCLISNKMSNDKYRTHPDNSGSKKNILFIDVGTGSGCIPIAVASTCHCDGVFFATDISRKALRVAKKNAKRYWVKINFLQGDLLEPIFKHVEIRNSKFEIRNLKYIKRKVDLKLSHPNFGFRISNFDQIVITANLPYLTREQFNASPSIQKEPLTSLVADNRDGLFLYEKLLKQINILIFPPYRWSPEGRQYFNISQCIILFEIGPSQSIAITCLINEYLPNASIEIKKDLAGLDRMVKICLSTAK